MSEHINKNSQNRHRQEYISRINRVLDYIDRHIDQDLTLEELARVANFSRFHFHRVFKAMIGETLNRYVGRIRIEKAAVQLIYNPQKPITEIALDCGFSGSAVFSRTFREYFKMSPSQWRSEGHIQGKALYKSESKIHQTNGKIGKDLESVSFYIDDRTHYPTWRIIMKDLSQVKVEVKNMPELNVVYTRHIGPYKGDEALFNNLFNRLMAWAAPRGLLRFPETQVLAVYHDDPDLTEEENLRVSTCITVPADTEVDGEIGKMVVPGGMFAVARFEITSEQYEAAWNTVMGEWMPGSGFQCDDRLCYELCHNNSDEHPEKKHIVDICVPVKSL